MEHTYKAKRLDTLNFSTRTLKSILTKNNFISHKIKLLIYKTLLKPIRTYYIIYVWVTSPEV